MHRRAVGDVEGPEGGLVAALGPGQDVGVHPVLGSGLDGRHGSILPGIGPATHAAAEPGAGGRDLRWGGGRPPRPAPPRCAGRCRPPPGRGRLPASGPTGPPRPGRGPGGLPGPAGGPVAPAPPPERTPPGAGHPGDGRARPVVWRELRRRPAVAPGSRRTPPGDLTGRYLRNLLVVLSASTLPPVWQVGAVGHLVGAVLDVADHVAADRARLALAVVDRARAAPSTTTCRRAPARRPGPRRRRRRMASTSAGGAVVDQLGGGGERGEAGPVADLVGQAAADAGDRRAGRGGSRAGARGARGAGASRASGVDLVGVGPEAGRAGGAGLGVAGDHPHPGLALGPGLGEQQGPVRRRAPTGRCRPAASWPAWGRAAAGRPA